MTTEIILSDRSVAAALAEIYDAPHREPIQRDRVAAPADVLFPPSVRRRAIRRGNNFDSSGLVSSILEGI